jgi:non-homologous end joining protein Ku
MKRNILETIKKKVASNLSKISQKKSDKSIDYKTLLFFKTALSLDIVLTQTSSKDINIDDLLSKSYEFLSQELILTNQKKLEYEIFKDKYNHYLHYCIESKLGQGEHEKVDTIRAISVPNMSSIKVEDISIELENMNFKIDDIVNKFSSMFDSKNK